MATDIEMIARKVGLILHIGFMQIETTYAILHDEQVVPEKIFYENPRV